MSTPLTLYVLRCRGHKFYVGRTNRAVEVRFEEHLEGKGRGSAWTEKHEPLEILQVLEGADEFDEDKHTKKLMKEHGIDNVRGGSYTQLELTEDQRYFLQRELYGAAGKCFRCGESGHFANSCRRPMQGTMDFDFELETDDEGDQSQAEQDQDDYDADAQATCHRCGHQGHWRGTCFAKWHVQGYRI